MPFCPQCGVDNPAAARYCDQCGAMLIPVTSAAPVAVPAPAPSMPASFSAGGTLVSSGPICPQCGHQAIAGEAFCDNCGASLNAPARPIAAVTLPPGSGVASSPSYPPPQPSSTPAQRLTAPGPVPPIVPSPPVAPPASYQPAAVPSYTAPVMRTTLAPSKFMVAASGALIGLPATAQVIIGRADPVSQYFPDIDLTPHGALENGVGRRHIRLFVQGPQLMIEDMESTNGTLVNGQRLPPHQARALRNGDQVTVGKLVLQYQE